VTFVSMNAWGSVGGEVWFVQRRGVDDGVDALRYIGDELTVADRSHPVGERRGFDIDAAHGALLCAE